jgi:NhaP-type Na+/H+ or K+/H+ antiporter
MQFALWLALGGTLLVALTLGGSLLARLPLSTAMLMLGVGASLGPWGLDLAAPSLFSAALLVERATEVIVLLSLFGVGLKMSPALSDRRWFPPLRLALLSMLLTVGLITAIGVWGLGLPLGAAVLLGGILAPTDPVLATEVQLSDADDRDALRFSLTGEGGLNDGTAFPVVMLGLGLLGLHEIGTGGWRWLAVDVLWAASAGIGIGAALGVGVGRIVLHLRRKHDEALGHDNFLALGLIGLAYGLAVLLHAYGFLAVFAAGLALRHTEQRESRRDTPASVVPAVMQFNDQLDRFGELAGVALIGLLLWAVPWVPAALWFVPLVLLGVRPLSVMLGLMGSRTSFTQRRLIAWFGIRGIGSVYYLSYALNHGLPPELARTLAGLTLAVVVASVLVHGVSVTPLMARYRRQTRASRPAPRPPP